MSDPNPGVRPPAGYPSLPVPPAFRAAPSPPGPPESARPVPMGPRPGGPPPAPPSLWPQPPARPGQYPRAAGPAWPAPPGSPTGAYPGPQAGYPTGTYPAPAAGYPAGAYPGLPAGYPGARPSAGPYGGPRLPGYPTAVPAWPSGRPPSGLFPSRSARPTYREPFPSGSSSVLTGAGAGALWMLLFAFVGRTTRSYCWWSITAALAAWLAAVVLARSGDRGIAAGVAMASGVGLAVTMSVVVVRWAGGHWVLW